MISKRPLKMVLVATLALALSAPTAGAAPAHAPTSQRLILAFSSETKLAVVQTIRGETLVSFSLCRMSDQFIHGSVAEANQALQKQNAILSCSQETKEVPLADGNAQKHFQSLMRDKLYFEIEKQKLSSLNDQPGPEGLHIVTTLVGVLGVSTIVSSAMIGLVVYQQPSVFPPGTSRGLWRSVKGGVVLLLVALVGEGVLRLHEKMKDHALENIWNDAIKLGARELRMDQSSLPSLDVPSLEADKVLQLFFNVLSSTVDDARVL